MIPRIIVKCDREVAISSPDHLVPWGTLRDDSHNPRFNEKLYALFPRLGRQLRVLDIGCAGGGFVEDCHDDACLAVGLEGSDYSKKHQRAAWRSIPERLFTCDVAANFEVFVGEDASLERALFDVVTAWEFIEHIAERDIHCVVENVLRHLGPGGLWIMSVSPNEHALNGVRLHQTVRERSWWVSKFRGYGLIHHEEYVDYFNTQFIRGPKHGDARSFFLVLARDEVGLPEIPRVTFLGRVFDRWSGSAPQRLLHALVSGKK